VDNCGIASGVFGLNVAFNQVLTENAPGPPFKFNMFPYGRRGSRSTKGPTRISRADSPTPYFDLTNSSSSGMEINYMLCANSRSAAFANRDNRQRLSGISVRNTRIPAAEILAR